MNKKLLLLALVPILSGCDNGDDDDVVMQSTTQNATADTTTTDTAKTDTTKVNPGYSFDETIDVNEFAEGLSNEGSQLINSTVVNTPVMYTDGTNYVLAYRSDKELDHEDDVKNNSGIYLTTEEIANPEEIYYQVNSFNDAASASAFEASLPGLYVNGQAIQYTVQKVDYKLVK